MFPWTLTRPPAAGTGFNVFMKKPVTAWTTEGRMEPQLAATNADEGTIPEGGLTTMEHNWQGAAAPNSANASVVAGYFNSQRSSQTNSGSFGGVKDGDVFEVVCLFKLPANTLSANRLAGVGIGAGPTGTYAIFQSAGVLTWEGGMVGVNASNQFLMMAMNGASRTQAVFGTPSAYTVNKWFKIWMRYTIGSSFEAEVTRSDGVRSGVGTITSDIISAPSATFFGFTAGKGPSSGATQCQFGSGYYRIVGDYS